MGRSLDFTELSGGLDLESALIYDAVHLLAVSLGHLRDIQTIRPRAINCGDSEESNYWQHGLSILNFMRVSHIPGLSRDVQFDSYGRRTVFDLDILNLYESDGLVKVGSWDDKNGIVLDGMETEGVGGWEGSLLNRSLVVTTILNPPYMMIKESSKVLAENNQYEGFVPDMVDILAQILHFNYTHSGL